MHYLTKNVTCDILFKDEGGEKLMKKIIILLFVFVLFTSFGVIFAEASFVEFRASNLQECGVKLSIDNDHLVIEELPDDECFEYLTAVFYKGSGYKSVKSKTNIDNRTVKFKIPYYSDDDYEVAVFYGNEVLTPFLPYSIVINIDDGEFNFVQSPTYKANYSKYESSPSSKEDMDYYSFYYLSENDGDEQLRNVVKSLISGKVNNYEKAYSIYNWLAENFYYDSNLKDKNTTVPKTMKELLVDKVCDSNEFATLYSTMLRSAGIPSRSVFGIALVNNRNATQPTVHHYWNEVYLDGGWIIVDVSMACSNRYIDGNKIRSPKTSDIYFDSTLDFFSYSHNIVSYEEPAYYEGYDKISVSAKRNGTPKTIEDLGIPKLISVNTSIGKIQLSVEWDIKNCKYDPSKKDAQTFSVNGYVILPSAFAACNSLKQNIVVEMTVNERIPQKAEIVELPQQLVFFQNSKIDSTGLELKVTFDNGDVESVKRTYVLEYDFSKVGKTIVLAKYKTVETSFHVEIVSKTPNEIIIESQPIKTNYFINEKFDPNGLKVVAICDKGLSYEVDDYSIEYDFNSVGNKEVLLTYKGFSAIIKAVVEEIKPIRIELLKIPDERVFYLGSIVDFSGISAQITYSDGTLKTVSDGLTFNYDVSKVGKSNVQVIFSDLSTSFEIEVIEREENSENNTSLEEISKSDVDESIEDTYNSNSNNYNDDEKNNHSLIVEIIAIFFICILLIGFSVATIMKSNELQKITTWIKNK